MNSVASAFLRSEGASSAPSPYALHPSAADAALTESDCGAAAFVGTCTSRELRKQRNSARFPRPILISMLQPEDCSSSAADSTAAIRIAERVGENVIQLTHGAGFVSGLYVCGRIISLAQGWRAPLSHKKHVPPQKRRRSSSNSTSSSRTADTFPLGSSEMTIDEVIDSADFLGRSVIYVRMHSRKEVESVRPLLYRNRSEAAYMRPENVRGDAMNWFHAHGWKPFTEVLVSDTTGLLQIVEVYNSWYMGASPDGGSTAGSEDDGRREKEDEEEYYEEENKISVLAPSHRNDVARTTEKLTATAAQCGAAFTKRSGLPANEPPHPPIHSPTPSHPHTPFTNASSSSQPPLESNAPNHNISEPRIPSHSASVGYSSYMAACSSPSPPRYGVEWESDEERMQHDNSANSTSSTPRDWQEGVPPSPFTFPDYAIGHYVFAVGVLAFDDIRGKGSYAPSHSAGTQRQLTTNDAILRSNRVRDASSILGGNLYMRGDLRTVLDLNEIAFWYLSALESVLRFQKKNKPIMQNSPDQIT